MIKRKYFDGFWVYLLFLFGVVALFAFFQYRKHNPASTIAKLVVEQSRFAVLTDNPCTTAIYGDPSIDEETDSWLKVNFTCPDGTSSKNTLRYNALGANPTILSAIVVLSKINNFNFNYNEDSQTLDIGKYKTVNNTSWILYINGKPRPVSAINNGVNGKESVDFVYE